MPSISGTAVPLCVTPRGAELPLRGLNATGAFRDSFTGEQWPDLVSEVPGMFRELEFSGLYIQNIYATVAPGLLENLISDVSIGMMQMQMKGLGTESE